LETDKYIWRFVVEQKRQILVEIFRDELAASQSLGRILERRLFMSRLLFSVKE
jgi:hypothetical protein